ncbi:MAG: hypothetical protein C4289_00010 [Chloroflexota bacterium]
MARKADTSVREESIIRFCEQDRTGRILGIGKAPTNSDEALPTILNDFLFEAIEVVAGGQSLWNAGFGVAGRAEERTAAIRFG